MTASWLVPSIGVKVLPVEMGLSVESREKPWPTQGRVRCNGEIYWGRKKDCAQVPGGGHPRRVVWPRHLVGTSRLVFIQPRGARGQQSCAVRFVHGKGQSGSVSVPIRLASSVSPAAFGPVPCGPDPGLCLGPAGCRVRTWSLGWRLLGLRAWPWG